MAKRINSFGLSTKLAVVLCAPAAVAWFVGASACAETDKVGWANVGESSSSAGGAGGSGSSSSSSSGSGGAGGAEVKCETDVDCEESPKGAFCDTGSGRCVECVISNDLCLLGTYCDAATSTCVAGCTDDGDCAPGTQCEVVSHACVACSFDAQCLPGTVCVANTCVPGCSPAQPCQAGFSCCGTTCLNLSADPDNCGMCLYQCQSAFHRAPLCMNEQCVSGPCDAGWGDCNGQAIDGCEHNVLQDGACLCAPGSQEPCYDGPPMTLDVGPCKGGMKTCDASGLAYSACAGEVLPSSEVCANSVDEDCDGVVDNVMDADGDGWTACNGDCCDTPMGACQSPENVNPGAVEIVGNGVDDDCDPATSDAVQPAPCSAGQLFASVTASDVAKAMDICQTTAVAPPLPQKKWGLITAQQLLANGNAPSAAQLSDIQNWQTAVLTSYGTGGVVPKRGPTMAGMSTGRMRDVGEPGYMDPNGGVDFTWKSVPPPSYVGAHGNQLPSSQGCSGSCPAGVGANDPVNVRLKMRVPTNAKSLSYDFRFFSAEYWLWTCQAFNDFYLALLQTTAPGIPADKNISFDALGNPVSVNNSFFEVCKPKGCYMCPSGPGELAGTGMELNNTGGATKWLTTDAPVTPGEVVQLELIVFDVSDNVLDSLVLVDNFRWSSNNATVATHQ